jgi:hypothetical protein
VTKRNHLIVDEQKEETVAMTSSQEVEKDIT